MQPPAATNSSKSLMISSGVRPWLAGLPRTRRAAPSLIHATQLLRPEVRALTTRAYSFSGSIAGPYKKYRDKLAIRQVYPEAAARIRFGDNRCDRAGSVFIKPEREGVHAPAIWSGGRLARFASAAAGDG